MLFTTANLLDKPGKKKFQREGQSCTSFFFACLFVCLFEEKGLPDLKNVIY